MMMYRSYCLRIVSASLLLTILIGASQGRSLASERVTMKTKPPKQAGKRNRRKLYTTTRLERAASEYIVRRIMPHYPVIASNLLTVLLGVQNSKEMDNSDLSMRHLREGFSAEYPDEKNSEEDSEMVVEDELLPRPNKRGMGHCIHKCINGGKHMNFIQCKSMCH